MHPEVRQQGPGACPKCGMALEPLTRDAWTKKPTRNFALMTRRFWISVTLTAPLIDVAMSAMIGPKYLRLHVYAKAAGLDRIRAGHAGSGLGRAGHSSSAAGHR